jgi:hypothetical protein
MCGVCESNVALTVPCWRMRLWVGCVELLFVGSGEERGGRRDRRRWGAGVAKLETFVKMS